MQQSLKYITCSEWEEMHGKSSTHYVGRFSENLPPVVPQRDWQLHSECFELLQRGRICWNPLRLWQE